MLAITEGGKPFLNIIIHYPKTQESMEILAHRIALVHAEAAKTYIDRLACPKEQKLDLIKAVQDSIRS